MENQIPEFEHLHQKESDGFNTKIYYAKDSAHREVIMGSNWMKKHNTLPDPENIEKTHTLLGYSDLTDLEGIFHYMQGENWSPNGEARPLISSGDYSWHTSMSVGDIVVLPDGSTYMVDRIGFYDLKNGGTGTDFEPIKNPTKSLNRTEKKYKGESINTRNDRFQKNEGKMAELFEFIKQNVSKENIAELISSEYGVPQEAAKEWVKEVSVAIGK